MPACPHCGDYYFGNPDQCPKCSYDFKLKRVVTKAEADAARLKQKQEAEAAREKIRQQEERLRQQEEKRIVEAQENRFRAFEYNAHYEYETVYLADGGSGLLDKSKLDQTLKTYASKGWRLHSLITNEAGKNSFSYAGIGTNATMDVTILIFERCIKLPGQ